MTDREMIELAALAAGYENLGVWDEKLGCMWDGEGWTFNPPENDGDAFRLAVRLQIDLVITDDQAYARKFTNHAVQQYVDDPCAAARLAITRIAAMIGATK